MRIIIFLLLISFITKPAICQQPSKKEMQAQMLEAVNEINKQIADLEKQIAEAKKNKEDEETIRDLEDQLAMLKKQVAMMGGVNKSLSGISEKTFQQAGEEEAIVPMKDVTRINMLPKKILTEAELVLFIKNIHTEVEKIIPPAEKTEALIIYNETKTENKSLTAIGSAASGCWMYGHQEKALWIMGKACIDNSGNIDNLNNYAAFLSMMGGEQVAIPILLYLNNKFPNNTSLLNNLGQAWFGLGDIAVAKKYLESATELYSTHSMANATLSKIYLAQPDTPRAIAALKRSINESYSTEKEGSLTGIGGILTTDDLPEFNYPVEKDPFGFDRFFNIIPASQNSLAEQDEAVARWQGFEKALTKERETATAEYEEDKKIIEEFKKQMVIDGPFREKILYSLNSPAHILAKRYLDLTHQEEALLPPDAPLSLHSFKTTPFPISMLIKTDLDPVKTPGKRKPITYTRAFLHLTYLIQANYYSPLGGLVVDRKEALAKAEGCEEVNSINQKFLDEAKRIREEAMQKIQQIYNDHKNELDLYLATYYYGSDHIEKFNKFFNDVVADNDIPENKFKKRKAYKEFLDAYVNITMRPQLFLNTCEGQSKEIPEQTTTLPPKKEPDCSYEAELAFVNGMAVKMKCGRVMTDETKLKNLKSGETKGSAITSKQQSPVYDPAGFRGPSFFSRNLNDFENFLMEEEPLFPGQEDNTALYIEYDKFGNLTDFKMKLNKDGSGLADTNIKKNGLERRWTWIATSSGREQKLSSLLKK